MKYAIEIEKMDGDGTIESLYFECGQCGSYHPASFYGDCREDAWRFDDYKEAANRELVFRNTGK